MTLLNAVIILLLVLGVLLAVVLLTRRRDRGPRTAAVAHRNAERPREAGPVAHPPAPADAETLATVSRQCLAQGDLDRALKGFRSLLLLPLDAGPITKAEVYLHLGEIHERKGELRKAISMLERALESDPTLAPARELLARLSAGA